ncbi:MAG: IPT/TIG domain-containing protein, partial [Longimicrobiales bacterium]
SRGSGVAGTLVEFVVESGAGSVTTRATISDAGGAARTRWTLGTVAREEQRLVARADLESGPVTVTFRATAVPGPAAKLTAVDGNNQRRAIGVRLRDTLATQIVDRFDNPIPGVVVRWTVTAGGGTLSVTGGGSDADGRSRAVWILGTQPGENRVDADAAELLATFVATADPAPVILSITPDTAAPGSSLTLAGTDFSDDPVDTEVLVNGVAARILTASRTKIVAAVPCEPSGTAALTVATNGITLSRTHMLRNAAPLRLAVGEAVALAGGDLWCNEIAEPGGRYVLTVTNPAPTSPPVSFRLRGEVGTTSTAAGVAPAGRRASARRALLAANNRILARGLSPAPSASAIANGMRTRDHPTAVSLPAVGDTLLFRVPDVTAGNLCSVRGEVSARVVHVGARAVVLEDVTAPLATRMDSLYRVLGTEYDTLHYPLLVANFGDPLAFDAETDANGHIYLLFTPVVNELSSVAGFVTAGNFFPTALCQASNRAEIFFGMVPTEEGGGFGSLATRDNWFRTMRAVVVHENKHIASYAERLSRDAASFEEPWLEEATAMIAEELYARTYYGYGQGANTNYQSSLFCEARPTTAACRGLPFVMYDHFTLLGSYLASIEARTPLAATSTTDISFYGSGWAFLRWLLDQSSAGESTFLRELTIETSLSGAANLQARSGRTVPDALADWITALALDDRPGFAPASPVHTLPSWNLRDVFARMNIDFPTLYPQAFPLNSRAVAFGDFVVTVNGLLAGTGAVFEIGGGTGTPAGPQLIEVAGDPAGSLATAGLRARLVRIQ